MSSQPVCMAGKAGVHREKTLQAFIYFLFHLIIHFLLLDNSIAYMFIHTAHAYALTSFSIKWMGLREIF